MTSAEPSSLAPFAPWMDRWGLVVDGEPFVTAYAQSRLLPVRSGDTAAMLKLGTSADERRGAQVLAWWDGRGAAPVLEFDGEALLMARAIGSASLGQIATEGGDDEATDILCGVVERLHAPGRAAPTMPLPPLHQLFEALIEASHADWRIDRAAQEARALLAAPEAPVVLHADIHHGNVLQFAAGDWRAIDPWGYLGERAYDYANIVRNPDIATVTAPGRLARQIQRISGAAGLSPDRFRRWAFAHAGLAAAWDLSDGQDPSRSFAVLDGLMGALEA